MCIAYIHEKISIEFDECKRKHVHKLEEKD